MRILLVEGYLSPTKAALSPFFQAEGLVIEHSDTGDDALEMLRRYQFDMIVLNRDVPDMTSTSLISRVRTAGHHTPVIALLGATNTKQRLAALSAGADDVVEHDTDRAELLARMRAIRRRSRGFSQSAISCGKVTLNREQQHVMIEGEHVHLTHKEFALLQLLMMRKNMVMTKEAILTNLYGGIDEPEIKIIDVFVCKVRNKLAKAGTRGLILTVWGRGYVVRDVSPDNNKTLGHVDGFNHDHAARKTDEG